MPARRVLSVGSLREFIDVEVAGGLVLLAGAVVALAGAAFVAIQSFRVPGYYAVPAGALLGMAGRLSGAG